MYSILNFFTSLLSGGSQEPPVFTECDIALTSAVSNSDVFVTSAVSNSDIFLTSGVNSCD